MLMGFAVVVAVVVVLCVVFVVREIRRGRQDQ
jgi:hypothetical protein